MPRIRADQVREGDLLDLENDPFADRDGENQSYKFEYAEVIGTELELPHCLRIDLDDGAFACPPEHELELAMVTDREDGAPPYSHDPLEHSNYPHEPGRLVDCPACEARCWCDSQVGTTECVFSGEHRWTTEKDES